MNRIRNEQIQRRTDYWCYDRVGWSSRAECVEVVWTHGKNGGVPVSEEKSRIQCERCEVEKKAMNEIDGWCEKGTEQGRMIVYDRSE